MVGTVRLVCCTGMHRRSELTRGYPRLAVGSWQLAGESKFVVRLGSSATLSRLVGQICLFFPSRRIKAPPSADALSQAPPPP